MGSEFNIKHCGVMTVFPVQICNQHNRISSRAPFYVTETLSTSALETHTKVFVGKVQT
jgi:hypothetical protein